jgi:CheY-like chemotaxis protein
VAPTRHGIVPDERVGKEFTCFLIDDDADDQEIFLSVLETINPTVHCVTARNGREAMLKLTTEEVKPDLIFLDLNMPLMNGKQFLEACSRLEDCRKIPVVILSTSSDRQSIQETLKLGARNFITKPDKFSVWGRLIEETINAYRQL